MLLMGGASGKRGIAGAVSNRVKCSILTPTTPSVGEWTFTENTGPDGMDLVEYRKRHELSIHTRERISAMPDRSRRDVQINTYICLICFGYLEGVIGLYATFEEPEPVVEFHAEDGYQDS